MSDVSRAIALARDAGHSVVDGGIVLDLSTMKTMDVDPGLEIA